MRGRRAAARVRMRTVALKIADLARFGVAPIRDLAPCSRARIRIWFPTSCFARITPKAAGAEADPGTEPRTGRRSLQRNDIPPWGIR